MNKSDIMFFLIFICCMVFSVGLFVFVNGLVGALCIVTIPTVFFVIAIVLDDRKGVWE